MAHDCDRQSDRPTDLATRSVATVHIRSTTMRPHNYRCRGPTVNPQNQTLANTIDLDENPSRPNTRRGRVSVINAFKRWRHNLFIYCQYRKFVC